MSQVGEEASFCVFVFVNVHTYVFLYLCVYLCVYCVRNVEEEGEGYWMSQVGEAFCLFLCLCVECICLSLHLCACECVCVMCRFCAGGDEANCTSQAGEGSLLLLCVTENLQLPIVTPPFP